MANLTQQVSRYYAYFNYMVAIQRLIKGLYPSASDLVSHLVASKGYLRLKGNPSADQNRVAELLHNSWFTRILLAEISRHSNLVPFNSPWSVVQAYYSIFSAGRAYFLAQGRKVNDNHAATLAALASDLECSNSRFPMPWCSVLRGDPKPNTVTLDNASVGRITLTNPLCSPYTNNSWQHYGLFLKTTRRKMLDASIRGWKERTGRKRIRANERQILISGLRPTTIFDGLYRVRTRSNYQDIDSFAFGVSTIGFSSSDASTFHDAVSSITEYTLLVFEVLIAKVMKKKWLLDELMRFSSSSFVYPSRQTIIKHHSIIAQYV